MTGPAGRGESGSITLWLLGLCVMLLFLGGISLDLWRAYSERRALAGAADAAALAGVQALDVERFRATGQVALDPPVAEALARDALATQPGTAALAGAHVTAGTEQVTVTVTGTVDLTLLAVLMADHGPIRLRVTATAHPATPPGP